MVMGSEAKSDRGGINLVECLMEDRSYHHGVHAGCHPHQPRSAVAIWNGCGATVPRGTNIGGIVGDSHSYLLHGKGIQSETSWL